MNIKRLWYSPKIQIDSPDVIHQTLMFGSLDEISALKKTLGEKKLREIFLHSPQKVYTNSSLYFIKNFILQISDPIDDQQYLKHTLRHLG